MLPYFTISSNVFSTTSFLKISNNGTRRTSIDTIDVTSFWLYCFKDQGGIIKKPLNLFASKSVNFFIFDSNFGV